jgi:hypothetical protein
MARRRSALALIGFGFVVVVFALGYYLYLQEVVIIGSAPLPLELVELSLEGKVEGEAALEELAWMHQQGFSLNRGAIGSYGEQGQIVIYAAGTPFGLTTSSLVRDMREKIAAVDSPFAPIAEREINRRRVYELIGLGQKHFYFRSGDLIIWLAADESLAEEALAQVLDYYP